MTYRIEITKAAQRDMRSLEVIIMTRIDKAILGLENNPFPSQSDKLKGFPGYRLRVGDYRIVYTVDYNSKLVTIFRVKHRREVYRGL